MDPNGVYSNSALNFNDDYGPIHYAVDQEDEDKSVLLLELLLSFGLDVNLRYCVFHIILF